MTLQGEIAVGSGYQSGLVPQISSFYGIVICMYWSDHPPAHFHAFYGGFEAKVAIEDATVLTGQLPRRAYGLVRVWALANQAELAKNWRRSQEKQPLSRIEPLV